MTRSATTRWIPGIVCVRLAAKLAYSRPFARLFTWAEGLLWRFAGLVGCAWIVCGFAAFLYVEADIRWIVGVWASLFIPSWLATLWMWRPWRRTRWFVTASMTTAIIIALRFANRAHEVSPDVAETQVRRELMAAVLIFGLAGCVVSYAVLVGVRQGMRLGGSSRRKPRQ